MSDNTISTKWSELKSLVEALEVDVVKNADKGVAAAGVRVRKGLRQLQGVAKELVKLTLDTDKAAKASKD
jgi:Histone H1-like protein Hc1